MPHSISRRIQGRNGETYDVEINVSTDEGYRLIHGAMTGGTRDDRVTAEARVSSDGVLVDEHSQTAMATSTYHPIAEALRRVLPTLSPRGMTEEELAELVLQDITSQL